MDISRAKKIAHTLMQIHMGDLVESGWTLAFNSRSRSLGICDYKEKRIYLSKTFVLNNEKEEVVDTILHEIAHALTPGDGHGKKWRARCTRIGAKPNRTACAKSVVFDEPKWVVHVEGESKILKKLYRKSPRDWSQYSVRGRPETRGKLKQIKYEDYLRKFGS